MTNLSLHSLASDLCYAMAMCRIQYFRDPQLLPKENDLQGQAETWKRVYNTHLGKGTTEEYIKNYKELIEGKI